MNLKFSVLPGEFMPKVEYEDLILLFDTGASTPVWCGGISNFKDKFPFAKKMNYRFLLTGFGRSETELVSFFEETQVLLNTILNGRLLKITQPNKL